MMKPKKWPQQKREKLRIWNFFVILNETKIVSLISSAEEAVTCVEESSSIQGILGGEEG